MLSWGGQKGAPSWLRPALHHGSIPWTILTYGDGACKLSGLWAAPGFSSSSQDKAHTRHRLPMLCFDGLSPLHYGLTAGALAPCDDLGEGRSPP